MGTLPVLLPSRLFLVIGLMNPPLLRSEKAGRNELHHLHDEAKYLLRGVYLLAIAPAKW